MVKFQYEILALLAYYLVIFGTRKFSRYSNHALFKHVKTLELRKKYIFFKVALDTDQGRYYEETKHHLREETAKRSTKALQPGI